MDRIHSRKEFEYHRNEVLLCSVGQRGFFKRGWICILENAFGGSIGDEFETREQKGNQRDLHGDQAKGYEHLNQGGNNEGGP